MQVYYCLLSFAITENSSADNPIEFYFTFFKRCFCAFPAHKIQSCARHYWSSNAELCQTQTHNMKFSRVKYTWTAWSCVSVYRFVSYEFWKIMFNDFNKFLIRHIATTDIIRARPNVRCMCVYTRLSSSRRTSRIREIDLVNDTYSWFRPTSFTAYSTMQSIDRPAHSLLSGNNITEKPIRKNTRARIGRIYSLRQWRFTSLPWYYVTFCPSIGADRVSPGALY